MCPGTIRNASSANWAPARKSLRAKAALKFEAAVANRSADATPRACAGTSFFMMGGSDWIGSVGTLRGDARRSARSVTLFDVWRAVIGIDTRCLLRSGIKKKPTDRESVGFLGIRRLTPPSPHSFIQTSIFPALNAFDSMNARRGSTSSPISVVKIPSAAIASSICTRSNRRTVGIHRRFPKLRQDSSRPSPYSAAWSHSAQHRQSTTSSRS